MQIERDNKSDPPFAQDWVDFFAFLQKFDAELVFERQQPVEQQIRKEIP